MADGAPFDRRTPPTLSPVRGAGRVMQPPEVWAAARDDYLEGLSGSEVCAKYGIGQSTFRRRAAAEGWRRADQPTTHEFDEGAELEARYDGDLDLIEFNELAFVARSRMVRAVLRGAPSECLRWKQVADLMDQQQIALDRWIKDARAWEERRAEETHETHETGFRG